MAVLARRQGNQLFPEFPRFGRLFDVMMSPMVPAEAAADAFIPPVDVSEHDGHYDIDVAVPGFNKEDFSIDVEGNQVTISGQHEQSKKEDHTERYSEIRRAAFSRTIALPRELDPDTATATLENGILSIVVAPTSPIGGKKITVDSKSEEKK